MRLTLRTLLAYLDDILEPGDRADLQKQIDVSDYARDLVHRTRDVSRRLRLGAPEVLGTGSVDDPNTVAEYLDNTLPMESVPEFERVCLESDVMLAEVSASHHVLAMVLGKPAEVDPDTRQRMHDLPDKLKKAQKLRAEPAHSPSPAATETAVVAPEAVAESRNETVPDYLRQDRSALLRWVPALAALVLLSATAYMMFSPAAESDVAAVVPDGGADADAAVDASVDASTLPAIVIDAVEESDPMEVAVETPEEADRLAAAVDVAVDEPLDSIDETPADALTEMDPVDTVEADTPVGEVDSALPEEAVVAVDQVETPVEPEEPVALEPEPPADAGRFVGPDSCLLVAESAPGVWQRVDSEEAIALGGRLISLPTYRAPIELSSGVRLELVGLTQAELSVAEEAPFFPQVHVLYGHALLINPSEEPQKIELVVGMAKSVVEIAPGATIAIATDRPYDRGADVLNASPDAVTTVYAPTGGVTWTTDGMQMKIASSKQWGLSADGDPTDFVAYEGDPGWIESFRLSPWDEQASPLLSRSVFEGQEVWPQLREVIDGEAFKEVRALAARCSAAVSHPDPLIASFSDEAQRPVWADNLTELRRIVSRSTIEAERVRRALIEQHGEMLANDLFLMIRGFNEEQIGLSEREMERGALPQIIGWLESEALASRVLANLNLEEVTGRQAVFGPTDSPTKRRQKIRRLRKLFNGNELRVSS